MERSELDALHQKIVVETAAMSEDEWQWMTTAVTVARLEGELSDSPPALPEVGLEEIFAHWSGPGDLWAALAIVDDGGYARHWTDREIESRAHRVLLQHLESSLRAVAASARYLARKAACGVGDRAF